MGDWALVRPTQHPAREEGGRRKQSRQAQGPVRQPLLSTSPAAPHAATVSTSSQDDAFEWDQTDITLSTDQGLRWLQGIGIIPHHVSTLQRG